MQGTLLNTITFPEMTDLIRKEFVHIQQFAVPQTKQLYITASIANGNGNTKRMDEVDTLTFARLKRQGEAAKKAAIGIGYNVTITKKRIATEIDITQEMRDENRYPEVGSLIQNLGQFCPQRIELDGTHLFTFATATAYTDMDGESQTISVGDGLALCSTAHTLKFSALTYSNRVSGDPIFSAGALELAEDLATTNILSNFGEKRVMKFNTIITSQDPNTVNIVKRHLQSTSDVDQNNSGVINVNQNKYRHVQLPYLATTATGANDSTKKKYWFLAATGQGTNGWQAYYAEWEAPHFKEMPKGETGANHDYSRDIWTFGVRAGYGYRAVTGRGLIGAFPAST